MPSCAGLGSQIGLRSCNINNTPTISPSELLRSKRTGAGNQHVNTVDNHLIEHETTSQSSPRLEVRRSSGRGLGLFTLNHIPAYTKIIDDDALLSLAHGEDLPELWQKYLTLPSELRETFDALSSAQGSAEKEDKLIPKLQTRGYDEALAKNMARVSSKFQANAFKTSSTPASSPHEGTHWAYALFATIARINHSCTPNSHAHYNPASGSQMVYALREINVGEELEISYFDMTMTLADRQARARSWGFVCGCPACGRKGTGWRGAYESVLAVVRACIAMDGAARDKELRLGDAVSQCRQAVDLAEGEQYKWLVAALPRLYHNLAMILHRSQTESGGHSEQIVGYLQEALRWETRITGPSSPSSWERRAALRDIKTKLEL